MASLRAPPGKLCRCPWAACCRRGQRAPSCRAFGCQGAARHDKPPCVCRSSGSSVWESGRYILCAMPFASPYRFVSRRRGLKGGWVAQKPDQRLFREGFRTAFAAARWIAGELGLVVSELRRRSASGCQGAEAKRTLSFDRRESISRFRGVTPPSREVVGQEPRRRALRHLRQSRRRSTSSGTIFGGSSSVFAAGWAVSASFAPDLPRCLLGVSRILPWRLVQLGGTGGQVRMHVSQGLKVCWPMSASHRVWVSGGWNRCCFRWCLQALVHTRSTYTHGVSHISLL